MAWIHSGLPENEIDNEFSQAALPTKINTPKPSFLAGSAAAVPRGIATGVGKIVETIGDSPLSYPLDAVAYVVNKAYQFTTDDDDQLENFDQFRERGRQNREGNLTTTYDYLAPDVDDGLGANILYGLGDYLTRAAVGSVFGGIGGAAAVTGGSEYNYVTNDLVRKGVDKNSARVAGAIQGTTAAVLTATPLSFVRGGASGIAQAGDAALAIGAPVALDSLGRVINRNLLEGKGYETQAKQFEVTPETVITGLALGGVMHGMARYSKNKQAATQSPEATTAPDVPPVDDGTVTVNANDVQATTARNDQLNNTLSINQILFNEDASVPVHAPTPFQVNQHLQNMKTATEQLASGRPVSVPHNLQGLPKNNLPGQAGRIVDAAQKAGIDPQTALVISHIETGGRFNPDAQNPTSSANGLYQVIDSTWKRHKGGDRADVNEQIRVGFAHIREVSTTLQRALKRAPQVHEEYMGHLLGPGGASKVLTADPNARLYDVVYAYTKAKTEAQRVKIAKAVVNNNGMKDLTVGQAIAKWKTKTEQVQAKLGSTNTARAYGMDGSEHTFSYSVRSADDLITSNNNDFSINDLYPAELQPRDRTREASRQQIENMADDIKPELLADSYKLSDGAPIIGSDLVVESGNGRTMALKRAYEQGKAENYKTYLMDNAERLGLNRNEIEGMTNPVLVRNRISDVADRATFTRLANESDVAQMSSTERASSDASRLPDSTSLKINADGTINLDGSMSYVRQFIQGLPKSEQGSVIGKNGMLSQEGKRRIESALMHQAYRDPRLVERLTENLDDNSKNVLNALLKNAPRLAQLNDLVRQGGRHNNTVADDAVQAANKFSDLRANGLHVNDYLSQGQLVDDGLSDGARALLADFGNGRSAKQMSEAIEQRIAEVEGRGDPRQGDMFGDMPEVQAARQVIESLPDTQVAVSRINENGEVETITMSAKDRMDELEAEMKQAVEMDTAAKAAAACALKFGE